MNQPNSPTSTSAPKKYLAFGRRPKLSTKVKMIVGSILIVLLLVGGGAAFYLSKQKGVGDVRQQASGGVTTTGNAFVAGGNLIANGSFESVKPASEKMTNGSFENPLFVADHKDSSKDWSDPDWTDKYVSILNPTPSGFQPYDQKGGALKMSNRGTGLTEYIRKSQWVPITGGQVYTVSACAYKKGTGESAAQTVINIEDYNPANKWLAIRTLSFTNTDSWGCQSTIFQTHKEATKMPVTISLGKDDVKPTPGVENSGTDNIVEIDTDFYVDNISVKSEEVATGWEDPAWGDIMSEVVTGNAYLENKMMKLSSRGKNLKEYIRKTQWVSNGVEGGKEYTISACGKRIGDAPTFIHAEEYDKDTKWLAGTKLEFTKDTWECQSKNFTTKSTTTVIPVSIILGLDDKINEADDVVEADTDFFVDGVVLLKNMVPNCNFTSIPDTLTLGQTANLVATFYSPGGELRGRIGVGTNFTQIAEDTSTTNNLTITKAWKPDKVGDYLISCRAWNDGKAECRPQQFVDFPPRYECAGPVSYKTVKVVAAGVTNTPTPTRTPTPTHTPTPTPTGVSSSPTPSPTGSASTDTLIGLKVKLAGVPIKESSNQTFHPVAAGNKIPMSVIFESSTGKKTSYVTDFVYHSTATDGYYQTNTTLNLTSLPVGRYHILLKAPMSRQMRFCKDGQAATDQCTLAGLTTSSSSLAFTITRSMNEIFDLTGIEMSFGDLPISGTNNSQQDAYVNVTDYSYVFKCLNDRHNSTCIAKADGNYDGVVTNEDLDLLMNTLAEIGDEI